MHPLRKQRLLFILFLISSLSIAVGLALYALRQDIDLFLTPSEVAAGQAHPHQLFRLAGIVAKGSVRMVPHSAEVIFQLKDAHHQVEVAYQGLLPALFREGQDIVAEGQLNAQGVFVADQVLAKHDANYHPAALSSGETK